MGPVAPRPGHAGRLNRPVALAARGEVDRQARRQDHLRHQQRKATTGSQIITPEHDGLQTVRLRMHRHPHSAASQRQFLLLAKEDLQRAQDDLRAV